MQDKRKSQGRDSGRTTVAHDDFLKVLRQTAGTPRVLQIFAQQGPEYSLLLELVQPLYLEQPAQDLQRDQVVVDTSFREIATLLDEIVSGTAQAVVKAKFLAGISQSALFYERVLKKLREVTPELLERELPGFEQIRQKSDAELLRKVQNACGNFNRASKKTPMWLDSGQTLISFFRHALRPLRHPGFAGPAAVGLVAIVLFLFWPQGVDRFADFQYADKVPFEPPVAFGLRGGGQATTWTPEQLLFRNDMKDALGDYHAGDFDLSVNALRRLASSPKMRNLDRTDSIWVSLAREVSFYLGVSCLGQARTGDDDLDKAEIDALLKSARIYLEKARNLTSESDATPADRENYFLALVQAIAGDTQSSRDSLSRIPDDSNFSDRKNELLRILSIR